jgi:hypothetical protein
MNWQIWVGRDVVLGLLQNGVRCSHLDLPEHQSKQARHCNGDCNSDSSHEPPHPWGRRQIPGRWIHNAVRKPRPAQAVRRARSASPGRARPAAWPAARRVARLVARLGDSAWLNFIPLPQAFPDRRLCARSIINLWMLRGCLDQFCGPPSWSVEAVTRRNNPAPSGPGRKGCVAFSRFSSRLLCERCAGAAGAIFQPRSVGCHTAVIQSAHHRGHAAPGGEPAARGGDRARHAARW